MRCPLGVAFVVQLALPYLPLLLFLSTYQLCFIIIFLFRLIAYIRR